MIAIPDFVSGAMEHWGLITYRETTLLFDQSKASAADKQRVAAVVSHEMAHQWFGNLVTMKWWNDLWLNEGFASYMEYVGTESIEPRWEMVSRDIK
jgi:glutamyl aminopeptidase